MIEGVRTGIRAVLWYDVPIGDTDLHLQLACLGCSFFVLLRKYIKTHYRLSHSIGLLIASVQYHAVLYTL